MPVVNRTAPLLTVKLQATKSQEFRIVTDRILSFKYVDAERKADKCTITVDNSDLSNFDDPAWTKGAKIKVTWGYPGAMSPERTCVITAVKGFRQLSIEAKAESIVMNRIVQCRSFENKKVSDIVKSIANENGFSGRQLHVDDTGETFETITQARMTDAQFIRRWASRVGFEFYVDFDGFHFHERRLSEQPIRVLRYFTDDRGDFIGDPSIENDITAKPGKVKVKGRDPLKKKDHNAEASNSTDTERDSLTEITDVIDPETRTTFERETTVGSETTEVTADATEESAKKRAKAKFRRVQQVAVKMNANIVGDPLLFAKTVVQVEGMGKRLSVKYWVTEITHDLAASGYVCDLKLVSDGHGGHSTKSTKAVGLSQVGVTASGGGKGAKSQLVSSLIEIVLALKDKGLTKEAASVEKAGNLYRRSGKGATAEVARVLKNVARSTQKSAPEISQAAANVVSAMSPGGETESGGKVNNKKAKKDEGALQPVDKIDEETRTTRTTYERSTGKGSDQ